MTFHMKMLLKYALIFHFTNSNKKKKENNKLEKL